MTGGDGRVTQEAVGAGNCGLSHSLGWLQGLLWGILRRGILLQPRGLLEASKYTVSIQTSTFGCFALNVKSESRIVQFSGQLLLEIQTVQIQICHLCSMISTPRKSPIVNFLPQCHILSSSRFGFIRPKSDSEL